MAKIDIDASELDDMRDSILKLAKGLDNDTSDFKTEPATKMKNLIEASVFKNFENHNTDPEKTSLNDAFSIIRQNNGARITTEYSTADHALALEEGISPHWIEGNPWLAFEPDNINQYPEKYHDGNGNVIIKRVWWEPDKQETATGYKYVYEAQKLWDQDMRRYIPQKINSSIIQAGYKRQS